MQINFNIFDQFDPPSLILCNPNKDELYSIGSAYEKNLKIKFNALSELTFKVPYQTNVGDIVPYYDLLKAKRLIFIQGFGYFMIITVEEDLTGYAPIKIITANSLESELVYKRLLLSGTFQFYDPISPANTMLGQVLSLAPTWSIGYVDSNLLTLYRTFDINDKSLYDFLMNDAAQAYQCVFTFDSVNKLVNAYPTNNATIATDIYLSFDNLLKSGKFSELTDELVTALKVYGSGDLDIHSVNPLGTSEIYNFDGFKSTDWMSQGLVDAINAWEANIAIQQPIFANLLGQYADADDQLLVLQGALDDLNTSMSSLVAIQADRIQQGISYADINAQIAALQIQINTQNALITTQQGLITSIQNSMISISQTLSFSNSFTPNQLLELNTFIIENTYQNNNFLVTDSMTNSQIQDEAQQLYNQSLEVLEKVSAPRYEITIDSANFIFMKEFKPFTDQLQLGCSVTVDKGSGIASDLLELVLLEIDMTLDDPTKFTITMSNRIRLDAQGGFTYSDLFNQAVSAGSSVNFNAQTWSDWVDNSKDTVTTFIDGSLDASKNELISSNNQEITINQNGLRGKNYDPNTQTYSNNQVWLINNMLAFTKDNWQTASLALGQITYNNQQVFGLVSDVLVGRILAGNTLTITNQNNTFTVDGNGATFVDANSTTTGNGGNNRILINPSVGIKIQSLVNSQFVDKFYVDNAGNVTFAGILSGASGTFTGSITAQSGTIGGWTINSTGLTSPTGDFINSNGNFKIGPLSVSGNTGTFNGSFSASNLTGLIQADQIVGLPGSKITSGTIGVSSSLGSGGTVAWPGVVVGTNGSGKSYIQANNYIQLGAGSTVGFNTTSGTAQMNGGSAYLGVSGSSIYMNGSLYAPNGRQGLDIGFHVSTPNGNCYLYFSQGIFYTYSYG